MSTNDSGTPEERNITVWQILRAYRIKRALEEYEKFLEAKAYEFAWKNHTHKEDFAQEGRVAIWRARYDPRSQRREGDTPVLPAGNYPRHD
jgi:hypothetical protein